MFRRKILRMLKGGASPLNLAIRKWKDILYLGASDYGGKNCGLCVANTCEKCIIVEQTGLYSCVGTPYSQWILHHQTEHTGKYPIKIRCPKCVEIVNQEIKFLEDLRCKLRLQQINRNGQQGWKQITSDRISRIKGLLSNPNNSIKLISRTVHSSELTIRRVRDGYYDRQ